MKRGQKEESRRARVAGALRAAGAWARRHWILLCLSAAAGILYLPSVGNPFVYDDIINIVKNPSIRRLENLPHFFTRPETTTSNMAYEHVYRPLCTVSYAVDYALGRLDPRGYILHNVILHALATAAWISVARALTGSLWLAAVSGVVMGLHPVQSEPVNWATGRATILFSLFYFLALRLYVAAVRAAAGRATEAPPRPPAGRGRTAALWGLSWLAAAAALLSKEMAVTLPAALLLVEWLLPPDPRARWRARLARVAPYAALAALYLGARAAVLGEVAAREEYWGGSIGKTIYVMGRVMARYARLLVLPASQNLEHTMPIPESWWDAGSLAGLLLVTAAGAGAWWLRRRRPFLSFGLLWVGVILLPVSNLIPFYGLIAERHLYLAAPGFGLALGDLLAHGARLQPAAGPPVPRRPRLAVGALAAVALLYAGATLSRSRVWADEVLLWQDTIAKSPSKLKAYTNLGLVHVRRNQLDEALVQFHKALQINPRSAAAHAGLGLVHLLRNEPERALEELSQAVQANPRHLDAHKHLASAYIQLKRWREAERAARQALELREEPDIRYLLGAALFKDGRLEEAEEALRQVLKVDPRHADALRQMGLVRHRQERPDEAMEFYRQALAEAPAPDLFYNIAIIEIERGEYAAAAANLARARRLAPHITELALRQAQAEILDGLKGRVPPEALRALRTENVREHAPASVMLRSLPDAEGIASRLGEALAQRAAPEVRSGILATLALVDRARHRKAEARALYEQMLEAGGDAAGARLGAGEMASQMGDYAAAEEHLRLALQIDPKLKQAYARLGFVARLRGDAAGSLALHERALALDRAYEDALDGRCEALFDLDRWGEARGCFERRVRERPEHPQAHYYLGRVYQRLGNDERARREFAVHEEILGRRPVAPDATAASLE